MISFPGEFFSRRIERESLETGKDGGVREEVTTTTTTKLVKLSNQPFIDKQKTARKKILESLCI